MVPRNHRDFIKKTTIVISSILSLLVFLFCFACSSQDELPPPNILWLVSEDNSPLLGCYGDTFATTPNLDAFAKESFLYTHAYANAPVCAPARNTIITGVYANSSGNQHMRSNYIASNDIRFLPEFFRDIGYYCTNNYKTDYNTVSAVANEIWDECDKKAHYKNRKSGQPFFAIFNTSITHESALHKSIPNDELRHDTKKVPIPPYHPRTQEMEHDWAQYYDKMEDMDAWFGKKIKELEDAGLSENTIIFYYADHGGVLGRSKRFVYETGTHVPFIIHIPEKYKHLYPSEKPGDKVNRIISFVDLVPTLLSIIGNEIPDYLQGSAFLGNQIDKGPEYAYMFRGRMDERYDMSRSLRSKKYRYIRNYMPHRIYGQKLEYLWNAPSMKSWDLAFQNGTCNKTQSIFWNRKPVEELYDTENDPWEINNLAATKAYKGVLSKMRQANTDWVKSIHDTGFIPEALLTEISGNMPAYDFVRKPTFDIDKIIDAANISTLASEQSIPQLIKFLNNDNSAIRYWGATGLLILGEKALPAKNELLKALSDESNNVKVVAAEMVYQLGAEKEAINTLIEVISSGSEFAITHALNAVDCLGIDDDKMIKAIADMVKSNEVINRNNYALRAARMLFKKLDIDPAEFDIKFGW